MQPLEQLTNFSGIAESGVLGQARALPVPGGAPLCPPAEQCAGILLEAVPQIMRTLHAVIHEISQPEITVAQFRALMFVHRREGVNLSAAAEFLGLRLASTSKLVDHLVNRRLLTRAPDPTDRRRMILRLTARGEALLQEADDVARRRLAGMLNMLGGEQLQVLREGLGLLHHSFVPCGERNLMGTATSTFLASDTRQT
ncbi:MAG TPA: MarR family transcriptional regulator [Acidobacteriaceae bacterium]|jgi:DNA-binding MarR family transcriptional regulator|nr:MarR family transcriptional regulator [Acidobacteriaceae bacterium]